MLRKRRPTWFLVLVLALFLQTVGCSDKEPKEPDDVSIHENFRQHSKQFDELLKMFQEDVSEYNVSFVSVESPSRTACESLPQRKPCTLREGRWEKYQARLKDLGVIFIEHEKPGSRYYFYVYYQSYLMNARLKGIVFSEDQDPQPTKYHPKQYWNHINNGWYSYLMVDN